MTHRRSTHIRSIAPLLVAMLLLSLGGALTAAGQGQRSTATPPTQIYLPLIARSRSTSNAPAFAMEQTLSDNAQQMTIAFDGLAFLTGNLGADSFFPPGKVADFWGFQYLRDNDPSEMGHNTDTLRPSPRRRSRTRIFFSIEKRGMLGCGAGRTWAASRPRSCVEVAYVH